MQPPRLNVVDGDRSFGTNLAFLGDDNTSSGLNSVNNNAAGGSASGMNFALVGNGIQNAGNNNGGPINIAILPPSGEGNCTSGAV